MRIRMRFTYQFYSYIIKLHALARVLLTHNTIYTLTDIIVCAVEIGNINCPYKSFLQETN